MHVQGKFKMQAHVFRSRVVMNIAAFEVSHSVGCDIYATALLPAARARSVSIGALEDGSKSERTSFASFLYTFELVSVALPPELT